MWIMSSDRAWVRTVRVDRYTVTFTLPLSATSSGKFAVVEWSPEPRYLSTEDVATYRAARHQVLEEYAEATGTRICVVDV